MDRFLALQTKPGGKVPPIEKLLDAIEPGKRNQSYVTIANQLRQSKALNATYSLVSLRRIVELSPLSIENAEENALNPVNSYRWLYLISALAGKELTTDAELERAKVEFVMKSYVEFLRRFDVKVPFAAQFVTGVLCAIARLADYAKQIPEMLVADETYDALLKLLETSEFPNPTIDLQDFEVPDLFKFGSPVSLEFLPPTNLFGDTALMVRMGVLRVLYRIVPCRLPAKCDEFKRAVYPSCISGISVECGRRALIKLFGGDEDAAYEYTDINQYKACAEFIATLAKKSDKFENQLMYQDLIELSEQLSHILQVAQEHPKQWISFLAKSSQAQHDIGKDLQSILTSQYDIEFVIAAVKLLRLGQVKLMNYVFALKLLITSRSETLRDELSQLLLQHPEAVGGDVLTVFPLVCNYGSRSNVFFGFLGKLLPGVSNADAILSTFVQSLKDEYNQISQLSNAHIYSELSRYIDVPGSYLDPQPCTVCNNPERVATEMNVSRVKEFTKYQADTILVKLKQALTIHSFSLEIPSRRNNRRTPRIVKVFVSSADISEPSQLVTDAPKWRHVASLNFTKEASSASASLTLHAYATCLKFQITDVWEDTSTVSLHCPSCHAEIPDKRSGTCPRCGDNCYQCRNCRNINYNGLQSLICVECGTSPLGQLNWTIMAVPSFSHTHIQTEDDCDAALKKCDEILADAHDRYKELRNLKAQIDAVLSPAFTESLNTRTTQLNNLYNNKCKSQFETLTQDVQHVCAIRNAVAIFKNRLSRKEESEEERNICYNCRSSYIRNCLKFFVTVVKSTNITKLDAVSLLFSFVTEDARFTATAVDSLVAFCSLQWELTLRIVDIFIQALPDVSPQLVRLVCELEKLDDDKRAMRMPCFVQAIAESMKHIGSSSSFMPTVLQPLVSAVCHSPVLILTKEKWLMNRAFNALQSLMKNEKRPPRLWDPYELLLSKECTKDLLFHCPSVSVRTNIAELENVAAKLGHFDDVAKFIIDHIMSSNGFGKYDEQCYSVLRNLLSSRQDFVCSTLRSAFFDHLVKLFEDEVNKVMSNEENIVLNLAIGFEALQLVKVIQCYLGDVTRILYTIEHKEDLIRRLIMSYFKLRSLFIQRSKHLEDTLAILKSIILLTMSNDFVFNDEQEGQSVTSPVQQTQSEDQYSDEDGSGEEGGAPVVAPARPSVSRNEASEDQPLTIPNVKGPRIMLSAGAESIQFCPDIVVREISAIIFPPPVFLNVPIIMRKAPTQEEYMPGRLPNEPVMSHNIGTVFRDIKTRMCTDAGMFDFIEDDFGMELIVLNNIISLDLPIDEVYKKIWEPEQGQKPMVVTCRIKGLDGEATEPIITSFPRESTDEVPPEVKYEYTTVLCDRGFKEMLSVFDSEDLSEKGMEELVKLFGCFLQVRKNLESVISLNGVDRMFGVMKKIIDTASPELFENVTKIAKILLTEDKNVSGLDEKISFIFDAMKAPLMRNNENTVLASFLGLMPPIAAAKESIMHSVLEFFVGVLKTGSKDVNMFVQVKSLYMLNGFSEFMISLPENETIRTLILKEPIVPDAISFIGSLFPLEEGRNSKKWQISLETESLPSILKILAGMVMCHKPTQELFLADDAHLIKLLLELETMTSRMSVGDYASMVLANAMKEPSICACVITEMRQKKDDLSRQRAQAEMEKVLQENSGLSSHYLKMLEELDDEQSWQCCICREGYEFLPDKLLGVYVYGNKMGEFVSTATYFVCVHPECHTKDRPSERPRRGQRPVTEWEAAKVRNSEKPCNAIFPLPSRSIPLEAYDSAIKRFLDEFKNRGKADYIRMLMLDLKHHISITSKGDRIPLEFGGGSLTTLVELWPFLIFGGGVILTMETQRIPQVAEKLQQLIDSGDDPQLAEIMSIWCLNLEEWEAVSVLMLKRLIKASAPKEGEDENLKVRQAVIFHIIVDRVHRLIKKPSGEPAEMKENGSIVVSSCRTSTLAWFVKGYMDMVLDDGPGVATEFVSFAEEVESEILTTSNIRDLLIRAGVSGDPTEFVTAAKSS